MTGFPISRRRVVLFSNFLKARSCQRLKSSNNVPQWHSNILNEQAGTTCNGNGGSFYLIRESPFNFSGKSFDHTQNQNLGDAGTGLLPGRDAGAHEPGGVGSGAASLPDGQGRAEGRG